MERALTPTVRVIEHADALRAAIHAFIRDGDLDLRQLAAELAVGRSTLYRLVGNRDLLLGDVLWELARRTLVQAMREAREEGLVGLELLMTASTAAGHMIRGFPPLQELLRQDAATAFRVLFTPDGRVHERTVGWWTQAFQEAVEAGHLLGARDVSKLAYMHVRVCESMLYADLLAGREADLELAEMIQRAIIDLSTGLPDGGDAQS